MMYAPDYKSPDDASKIEELEKDGAFAPTSMRDIAKQRLFRMNQVPQDRMNISLPKDEESASR